MGGWVRPCVSPATAAAHSSARDRRARSASGPRGVRVKPRRRLPTAARASGTRGLRRDLPPTAPAFEAPHPSARDTEAGPRSPRVRTFRAFRSRAGVGVKSAPRARRAMAPERAGPERPDRRVETLAPTERLMRGRGTARVRTPGCACSVARKGGSELRPRRPQRATAHSPRGNKKPHAVTKKMLAAHPLGKTKPSGSEMHHRDCSPGRQQNREKRCGAKLRRE